MMNEKYLVLIDSKEFQQKILDCITTEKIDKFFHNSVFSDDERCKQAMIHGMSIASMFTSYCNPVLIKSNPTTDLQCKDTKKVNISSEELANIIVHVRNYEEKTEQYGCPFQKYIGHEVKCKDSCKTCWKDYFEQLSKC